MKGRSLTTGPMDTRRNKMDILPRMHQLLMTSVEQGRDTKPALFMVSPLFTAPYFVGHFAHLEEGGVNTWLGVCSPLVVQRHAALHFVRSCRGDRKSNQSVAPQSRLERAPPAVHLENCELHWDVALVPDVDSAPPLSGREASLQLPRQTTANQSQLLSETQATPANT